MPTYEYECRACQHQFEQFQSITAKPVTRCPACGKNRVRRLIGKGAGIIFKGTGFYQTDYRSDHYRKCSAEDKTAASKPEPAAAKADKPAAAKPAKPSAAGA